MKPAVEVRSISKGFLAPGKRHVLALSDVSLVIPSGKFTTLLGPSGCGKTTLLRTIAGFEAPDSGRVLIDGEDLTSAPPYQRPLNTVFQHYALFPHLDVAGNIAYGLEVAKVPRHLIDQRVGQALELVRLESMAKRKVAQLSGGQQQRVALARALVMQPKVLLLDEPMAALDRQLRKQMQVELKRLQNELGIAFVCVTHDQEEALSMSDVIVVMNRGKIEQVGSPREIYDSPRTEFSARFIGETNLLRGEWIGERDGCSLLKTERGTEILVADARPGEHAAIASLRPEVMDVVFGPVLDGHCLLNGVVSDRTYMGNYTRVDIDLQGDRITVVLHAKASVPDVGAPVKLSYHPRDVTTVSLP